MHYKVAKDRQNWLMHCCASCVVFHVLWALRSSLFPAQKQMDSKSPASRCFTPRKPSEINSSPDQSKAQLCKELTLLITKYSPAKSACKALVFPLNRVDVHNGSISPIFCPQAQGGSSGFGELTVSPKAANGHVSPSTPSTRGSARRNRLGQQVYLGFLILKSCCLSRDENSKLPVIRSRQIEKKHFIFHARSAEPVNTLP